MGPHSIHHQRTPAGSAVIGRMAMPTLRESVIRLWQTMRRRRTDADLAEELRSHLAIAADATQRNGDAPGPALRTARIEAGGVGRTLEALPHQAGLARVEAL